VFLEGFANVRHTPETPFSLSRHRRLHRQGSTLSEPDSESSELPAPGRLKATIHTIAAMANGLKFRNPTRKAMVKLRSSLVRGEVRGAGTRAESPARFDAGENSSLPRTPQDMLASDVLFVPGLASSGAGGVRGSEDMSVESGDNSRLEMLSECASVASEAADIASAALLRTRNVGDGAASLPPFLRGNQMPRGSEEHSVCGQGQSAELSEHRDARFLQSAHDWHTDGLLVQIGEHGPGMATSVSFQRVVVKVFLAGCAVTAGLHAGLLLGLCVDSGSESLNCAHGVVQNIAFLPAALLLVVLLTLAALFCRTWDWTTGVPQTIATCVLFLSSLALQGSAGNQHYTRWPAMLWSFLGVLVQCASTDLASRRWLGWFAAYVALVIGVAGAWSSSPHVMAVTLWPSPLSCRCVSV